MSCSSLKNPIETRSARGWGTQRNTMPRASDMAAAASTFDTGVCDGSHKGTGFTAEERAS